MTITLLFFCYAAFSGCLRVTVRFLPGTMAVDSRSTCVTLVATLPRNSFDFPRNRSLLL